jgi:thioredoxin-like negative regulator of GroEL
MSKDNNKTPNPIKPAAAKTPAVKPAPVKVAPLFRKIDWLVLVITFGAIWTAYLLTLAPEVTLQDSGELCTASYYAGIPHPPGYPFWAIYSWLWTVILPIGNVAWRVEVGESFAGAMACGLVGFMVSRGSSMLIEGIEELKSMDRKWENAICVVTGIVAGLMLGFDSFLWQQSVVINRISPFDVPWLMVVVLCLLRWIYAPQQMRYLYIAMFFFGLCATIHQTMLVAAMGIEVVVAIAHPRIGRSFFLGNSMVYLAGLLLINSNVIAAFNGLSPTLTIIFHFVGIASIALYAWFVLLTKETFYELARDGSVAAAFLLLAAVPGQGSFCIFLALVALTGFGVLAWRSRKQDLGWLVVTVCLGFWVLGVSFYLYEAISGMTNPPMEWGYPRTVEGFYHALSRGQYEKVNPTDVIHHPMIFIGQLGLLVSGLVQSFNWVGILIALLPFVFIFKMQRRERAWIIGLTSIYFCIGVVLTILMNTGLDRQSSEENKAFFTASHALATIMIGYGMALLAAYMATHYAQFRRWGLLGGGIAVVLAVYCLVDAAGKLYFGPAGQIKLLELPHWIGQAFAKDQYGLPIFANLILLAVPIILICALLVYRQRGPVLIYLCLLTALPVWSGLSHWYKSEQRNHWFGYWFGHDMFTPPFVAPDGKLSYDAKLRAEAMKGPNGDLVYPEMTRNTILFGGTDPGRFCPTYMIFCESFIPHNCQPLQDQNFDRRDVYLITQNALADGTYLDYLRAQYYRSAQKDPPFFSRLFRFIAASLMGGGKSGNVVTDINNEDAGKGNTGNRLIEGIASLLDQTLDKPFTELGARIEARRRAEGVYPPSEIYIPSPEDSQGSFQQYTEDVGRRSQHDQNFPNEPRQIRQGEEVHILDGRVSVSGQVAVMMINGLLCKVIFDRNPTNDFYIEESFPLDWMYPYETPSGIIMKINRQPLATLPDDVYKKDHEFWSKYSERLIGNWITYDTTVQQIADFAQKVYLGNNYAGFTGDRKFIRDDDGQKAFSKLRSSIAGIYAWRLGYMPGTPTPPEYMPKSETERQQLVKETDFAFKQAFAFCPYSPEAVFRYINFLLPMAQSEQIAGHADRAASYLDDAVLVAQTCQKLDPFNEQIKGLVNQLQEMKATSAARFQFQNQLQQLQTEAAANPTNFQNILALGGYYALMQDTNRAVALFKQSVGMFDLALANPSIQATNVSAMAEIAAKTGDMAKLEVVLEKLIVLKPGDPDAHYNLADLKAYLGKNSEALPQLQVALDLNAKRLLTNPAADNLLNKARTDPYLNSLRSLPEFQKLVPGN